MRITVLAVLIAVTSVAQDAPPGGVVEGTVINTATGAGIAGASVVLSGNPPARYQATSDIAGRFRITGVPPGNYHTTVEKDGFWPPSVDLSSFLNAGLHVASGGDPVKVEFKLAPFNTLRGRVIGPDGKPAKGVEVRLNPNIMANEVLTDDEGRFALENTRPGSYTLIAKPPDSAKPQQASDGTRIEMVTTYYPSAADQALAQQIVLSGQPDLGGYEIRMQSAPVYRVRGIVLNEDDKPSSGA